MTVNDFMEAIAAKLKELFPDRLAYYKKIKTLADGQHFVRCIDQSHAKRLDRQRYRSYSFEVLYFRKDDDALEFNAWVETMYAGFESLTVNGRLFHLVNAHAEPGEDMVFHFIFDVSFFALTDPVSGEKMEHVGITTEVSP